MKKFFTLIAVAVMAFAAQAGSLTVCDGEYYGSSAPVLGTYADTYGTTCQFIYPAEMLAEMAGNEITEITFYTLNDWYVNNGYGDSDDPTDFVYFEGARFSLGLMEVENGQFDEEAPVAYTGATVVAEFEPELGEYIIKIVLDQPFAYTGKDLLIETVVIEAGEYGATYFIGDGVEGYNCGYLYYYDNWYGEYEAYAHSFLPKATFAYGEVGPVDPPVTEQTAAPSSAKENYVYDDGNLKYNAYTVNLIETEPSTIYYRIGIMVDGDYVYGEWMEYTGEMNFTEEGTYMIEAYAVAENKLPSEHIWDGFTVSKVVDVEELMAGKTVASVRYYNAAGQEMQQAAGLTIKVTTYTDGTTNVVKVVK